MTAAYQQWITECKKQDRELPPLTRQQVEWAEWLLQEDNQQQLSKIGGLDSIYHSIRNYVKGWKQPLPITKIQTELPNEANRCCGRCDGVNDICVTDRVCVPHGVEGCEACYGKRGEVTNYQQPIFFDAEVLTKLRGIQSQPGLYQLSQINVCDIKHSFTSETIEFFAYPDMLNHLKLGGTLPAITIDVDYNLCDGCHRVACYLKLGIEKCYAIIKLKNQP